MASSLVVFGIVVCFVAVTIAKDDGARQTEATQLTRFTQALRSQRSGHQQCPDGSLCDWHNRCCPFSGGYYGCCPHGDGSCCGNGECCASDSACCHDGGCCRHGTQCCGEYCCPQDYNCCGGTTCCSGPCCASGGCCDAGETCCGHGCCRTGYDCCADGSGCCRHGYSCCNGDTCCPPSSYCCDDGCCSSRDAGERFVREVIMGEKMEFSQRVE